MMNRLHLTCWQLGLYALFCLPHQALGATSLSEASSLGAPFETAAWTSSNVKHVYGLPGASANENGTLSINGTTLNFAGKASAAAVPLWSILAVSAGSERVELWGLKGRLLRMAIPNGGGLAAAAVMHHKVNMLTVEFSDGNGGYHSAVFFLPADQAAVAVQRLAATPVVHREPAVPSCAAGSGEPGTVRVLVPAPNQLEVPAAYRGLVYEHLIDRLGRSKGVRGVYRHGEMNADHACPEYTVELSMTGFKPGSQVKRSVMGPVGFFVGTTQMTFDLRVVRPGVELDYRAQAKAIVRGESESIKVADSVAKKLVKEFTAAQKKLPTSYPTRVH